jgi:hypothetical protein
MAKLKAQSAVVSSELVRAWRPLIRKIVSHVDDTFEDFEDEWAQKKKAVVIISVNVKDVVKAARWLRPNNELRHG